MKKIILTGASVDSGNRGCSALAISTLYLLNRIDKKEEFNISFFHSQSNTSRSLNINGLELKYRQYEGMSLFSFLVGIIRTKFKSLKVFFNSEYFFCFCGGDSFSDIYGKSRFYSIVQWINFAYLFRKKVIFLPQTIGPFYDSKIKKKAFKALNKATAVFVRDHQSFLYLQEHLPQPQKQFEVIDLAFLLPYQQEVFEVDYIHIGLNISTLLWNGGYTQNNQFKLTVDYQQLIHRIIDFFISKPNYKIHLIPHDLALNKSLGNDYQIAKELYNEYKSSSVILSPFFLDAMEAKSYIAGMNFFMGSRMHATIAAFSSGVSVYPMAYSRKFTGLFIDTLKYEYCGDMTSKGNEAIFSEIIAAFDARDQLKVKINNIMNDFVTNRIKKLETELKQILE